MRRCLEQEKGLAVEPTADDPVRSLPAAGRSAPSSRATSSRSASRRARRRSSASGPRTSRSAIPDRASTSAGATWPSGVATRPRPSDRGRTTVPTELGRRRYRLAVGLVLAAERRSSRGMPGTTTGYAATTRSRATATPRSCGRSSGSPRRPSRASGTRRRSGSRWRARSAGSRRSSAGHRCSGPVSSSPPRPAWRSACSCSSSRASSGRSGEGCTSSRSCSPRPRRPSSAHRRCTTPRRSRSRWRPEGCSWRCAGCGSGGRPGRAQVREHCSGSRRSRARGRSPCSSRSSSSPRSTPGERVGGAPALVLALTAAVVLAPWLVNQQLAHGSALAFNRSAPSGSILTRRPVAFYGGRASSARSIVPSRRSSATSSCRTSTRTGGATGP